MSPILLVAIITGGFLFAVVAAIAVLMLCIVVADALHVHFPRLSHED